tara:strand:- start:3174 stop:3755 length:582 start_codon:yes stop_codon:yes gene_type:complete
VSKAASALWGSLLLAGCAGAPTIGAPASSATPTASEPSAGERPDWRQVATERDAERLIGWRSLLDQARQRILAGESRDELLAGEGLYEVDSAVGYEAPPAGLYRCNMTKLTGSQRQVGYIYDAAPDHAGDDRHGVFLGTLLLGDEDRLVPYGSRDDRDEAGIVQKLVQKRWRMIFPKHFYEADINIIDLQLIE